MALTFLAGMMSQGKQTKTTPMMTQVESPDRRS